MTTPTMTPPGWYPDPGHLHEFRFWDGQAWTPQVSDHGFPSTDQELRPPESAHGAPTAHPLATPAPPPPGANSLAAFGPQPGALVPPQNGQWVPAIARAGYGWSDQTMLILIYANAFIPLIGLIAGLIALVTPENRKKGRLLLALGIGGFVMYAIGTPIGGILFGLVMATFVLLASKKRCQRCGALLPRFPGPDGRVCGTCQAGVSTATAAPSEQDRLKTHRAWSFGFGLFFAVLAGIWAIASVGSTVSSGSTNLWANVLMSVITVSVLAVPAFLLLRSARNAKRRMADLSAELGDTSPPAAPGGPGSETATRRPPESRTPDMVS